jgi:hypothetical protein
LLSLRNIATYTVYSYSLIAGPRVVVYADGRVVADSYRVLTLDGAELSGLLEELRRDLAGFEERVDVDS